ncbi:metallophosphoesterase family protein [Nocardia carnea]|uniref:metallophosphoesterase family protein n=1 Tax=Nocardia carnea TaxID=37328 RepID=UPI0024543019|nr:exonuclease subunit SbcD [Nocardia carnea]
MRILHTSDWHIGFVAAGIPLLPAQEAAFSEIAALVEEHGVDVVVVSGDVFDKMDPTEAELGVCFEAFAEIADAGAQLVVIPGNHDSAARLGAYRYFTAPEGLHLLTDVADIGFRLEIDDEHGPVGFYGIPSRTYRRRDLGLPAERQPGDYFRAAMARIRASVAAHPGTRSVVLAHATVADPAARGVARLRVNSRLTIPVDVFSDVDYVALGDLHWPHAVATNVRYSGSPLPYVYNGRPKALDFDPPKSVWLVDLGPTGLVSATACPLTVPATTIRIAGTLAELTAHAVSFDYIHATLTDPTRPVGAWRELQRRFPHLIQVEWIDPASGEVKAIPLDHDEPTALAVPQTGEGPEFGFYGEGDEECLRCGAAPGQPCFRVRAAHGVEYNNGYHDGRGLTGEELAELGWQSYLVVDDNGDHQRLWLDPDQHHTPVKRDGCYPVQPRQPGHSRQTAA